jgi:hypothetical protein
MTFPTPFDVIFSDTSPSFPSFILYRSQGHCSLLCEIVLDTFESLSHDSTAKTISFSDSEFSVRPFRLLSYSYDMWDTFHNLRTLLFVRPSRFHGTIQGSKGRSCLKNAKHVQNVLCDGRNVTAIFPVDAVSNEATPINVHGNGQMAATIPNDIESTLEHLAATI